MKKHLRDNWGALCGIPCPEKQLRVKIASVDCKICLNILAKTEEWEKARKLRAAIGAEALRRAFPTIF